MIFNKKDRLNNLTPEKSKFLFQMPKEQKAQLYFLLLSRNQEMELALSSIACVKIPKRHHKVPLNTGTRVIEKTDIETNRKRSS